MECQPQNPEFRNNPGIVHPSRIGNQRDDFLKKSYIFFLFFLFDLILYVPSTIFQLNRDGSS